MARDKRTVYTNYYPLDGHDFVGSDDTRKLKQHNDTLILADHKENLAIFRAGAFQLLERYNAIDESGGWLVFNDTNEPGQHQSDMLLRPVPVQSLIMTGPMDPRHGTRTLTLITNSSIAGEQNQSFIATEHVEVAANGKSAHEIMWAKDGTPDLSKLPLFRITNEGDLQLMPIALEFLKPSPVFDPESPDDFVYPMGYSGSFEDQLYSFNYARRLFDGLKDQAPVACMR